MEECNQKVWNVFDQLGITLIGSATYFAAVDERISLKVATKGSSRGKENSKHLDY